VYAGASDTAQRAIRLQVRDPSSAPAAPFIHSESLSMLLSLCLSLSTCLYVRGWAVWSIGDVAGADACGRAGVCAHVSARLRQAGAAHAGRPHRRPLYVGGLGTTHPRASPLGRSVCMYVCVCVHVCDCVCVRARSCADIRSSACTCLRVFALTWVCLCVSNVRLARGCAGQPNRPATSSTQHAMHTAAAPSTLASSCRSSQALPRYGGPCVSTLCYGKGRDACLTACVCVPTHFVLCRSDGSARVHASAGAAAQGGPGACTVRTRQQHQAGSLMY
jgi:hypothetical protein